MNFSAQTTPLAMLVLVLSLSSVAAGDDELLRAIAEGYRENQASFTTIVCRYSVTKATASSVDRAIAGDLQKMASQEVLWVVDGAKVRFSSTADDKKVLETLRAATSDEVVVPFLSKNFLKREDLKLVHEPVLGKSGTLYGSELHQDAYFATPFSILTTFLIGVPEQPSPATLIEGVLKRPQFEIQEEQLESGHTVVKVSTSTDLTLKSNFSGTSQEYKGHVEYTIDPNRGFLMLRSMHGRDAQQMNPRYLLTEIKECSHNRWFPMRSLILNPASNDNQTISLTEINVLSLEVDQRPKESDFQITLVKGTEIVDRRDARTEFTIQNDTTITPDDLPALMKRAAETMPQTQRNANTRPSRTWLQVLNVLALLTIIAIVAIRRRSGAAERTS